MPDENRPEDYELLPHQEIEALKKELESLKDTDVMPAKKLHISLVELNRNIGKLLDIFEEAMHEIKVDEGGLSFTEKMKPLVARMDRMERNIEAIADVLSNVIAPSLSDIHQKLAPGASPPFLSDQSESDEPSIDLPPLPPPPR